MGNFHDNTLADLPTKMKNQTKTLLKQIKKQVFYQH